MTGFDHGLGEESEEEGEEAEVNSRISRLGFRAEGRVIRGGRCARQCWALERALEGDGGYCSDVCSLRFWQTGDSDL